MSEETLAAGSRHVAVAGARLFVQTWPGRGLPIVLLHDSLGAVQLWRDFPAQLAQHTGHPVLAYDRLGFGQSDAHPGPGRLAPDFIINEGRDFLAPLLDALGIGRVILFGHSVGGGMAVAAAVHMPQRVAAVITESSQAFTEHHTLEGIRAAQRNFADPAQLARLARYHGPAGDTTRAQWVLDAWIGNWLSPAFADWTLAPQLAALECPLLALHGELDEFGSAAQPQRFVGEATAMRESLMLAGCGHVPHREMPQPVLAAVADFLRRHVR